PRVAGPRVRPRVGVGGQGRRDPRLRARPHLLTPTPAPPAARPPTNPRRARYSPAERGTHPPSAVLVGTALGRRVPRSRGWRGGGVGLAGWRGGAGEVGHQSGAGGGSRASMVVGPWQRGSPDEGRRTRRATRRQPPEVCRVRHVRRLGRARRVRGAGGR